MILWAKFTLEINFADNLKAPFIINWCTSFILEGYWTGGKSIGLLWRRAGGVGGAAKNLFEEVKIHLGMTGHEEIREQRGHLCFHIHCY